MSEYSDPAGRRKFLKLVGGTAVLVPLAGLSACGGGDSASESAAGSKPAGGEGYGSGGGADMGGETGMMSQESTEKSAQAAAETAESEMSQAAGSGGDGRPKLALDDPQAKALGYVHDAGNVDQSKYARYQSGQACYNCQLFQAQGDEEWAGCSIFPGKLVNRAGWCSAYAPKA